MPMSSYHSFMSPSPSMTAALAQSHSPNISFALPSPSLLGSVGPGGGLNALGGLGRSAAAAAAAAAANAASAGVGGAGSSAASNGAGVGSGAHHPHHHHHASVSSTGSGASGAAGGSSSSSGLQSHIFGLVGSSWEGDALGRGRSPRMTGVAGAPGNRGPSPSFGLFSPAAGAQQPPHASQIGTHMPLGETVPAAQGAGAGVGVGVGAGRRPSTAGGPGLPSHSPSMSPPLSGVVGPPLLPPVPSSPNLSMLGKLRSLHAAEGLPDSLATGVGVSAAAAAAGQVKYEPGHAHAHGSYASHQQHTHALPGAGAGLTSPYHHAYAPHRGGHLLSGLKRERHEYEMHQQQLLQQSSASPPGAGAPRHHHLHPYHHQAHHGTGAEHKQSAGGLPFTSPALVGSLPPASMDASPEPLGYHGAGGASGAHEPDTPSRRVSKSTLARREQLDAQGQQPGSLGRQKRQTKAPMQHHSAAESDSDDDGSGGGVPAGPIVPAAGGINVTEAPSELSPDWATLPGAGGPATSLPSIGTAPPGQGQSCHQCLDGATLVATGSGFSLSIKTVAVGTPVVSFDAKQAGHVLQPTSALLLQGHKACVELLFNDGRTVTCTPDHRFLTDDGQWVEAQHMKVGATHIKAGVEYPLLQQPAAAAGAWTLEVPSLGAALNASARLPHALAFAGLLGYLHSGGCVNQTAKESCLRMVHRLDTEWVLRDIQLLTGVQASCRPEKSKTTRVVLPAALHRAMQHVCVSADGRMASMADFPAFLLAPDCPSAVVQAFLGGLFGGDGEAPSLRWGAAGLTEIRLIRHFVGEADECALTTQLQTLFSRVGLAADAICFAPRRSPQAHGPSKNSTRYVWRVLCQSTLAFANAVGFRYASAKQMRLTAGVSYFRLQALLQRQREFLQQHVSSHEESANVTRTGLSSVLDAAKAALAERECVHPVTEQYTTDEGERLFNTAAADADPVGMAHASTFLDAIDGVKFFSDAQAGKKTPKETMPANSVVLPTFRVQLIARRNISGVRAVFDLTVPKLENFAAAGLVAHNCKSRRLVADLVFCCNANRRGRDRKVAAGATSSAAHACRKKYCFVCLAKFYNEAPPVKKSPAAAAWPCPACRGVCCCAACRRIKARQFGELDPATLSPAALLAYSMVYCPNVLRTAMAGVGGGGGRGRGAHAAHGQHDDEHDEEDMHDDDADDDDADEQTPHAHHTEEQAAQLSALQQAAAHGGGKWGPHGGKGGKRRPEHVYEHTHEDDEDEDDDSD